MPKGQGALEYILLLGGVIAIVVVAYTMLSGVGTQANQMIQQRLEELMGGTKAVDGRYVFAFYEDFEVWEGWETLGKGKVSQSDEQSWEGRFSLKKHGSCHPSGGRKKLPEVLVRDKNMTIVMEVLGRRDSLRQCNADRFGLEDEQKRGYLFNFSHGKSPYLKIDKLTGWATYILASEPLKSDIVGSWYRARLEISEHEVSVTLFKDDGTEILSLSYSDKSFSSFSHFTVRGGIPYYLDLVRVWKKASVTVNISEGRIEVVNETDQDFKNIQIPLKIKNVKEIRLNGSLVPFCYEHQDLTCDSNPKDVKRVWVKLSINAKQTLVLTYS